MLPHLYSEDLLSDNEFEILSNSHRTRQEKINTLINGLPSKGSDFLIKFVGCLLKTTNGTGHEKLANDIILRLLFVSAKEKICASALGEFYFI